ncbi:hypothetical protein RCO27_05345 [Sphingosinicella sp. LHD-64]|uniref:hypothetical protein n=1 Tax=Sphingosinicella sp. LHD-64 TaxID=3072139 RepID=UPI00280F3004|nr:hypothetical protein [Sphingosinicella sp. LHD-64]MDQ8755647.1 hypothetical protein [Sphingosinicella sp. LHD-64]
MSEAMITLTMASFGLTALCITVVAGLKGWQGWLEVKRLELSGRARHEPRGAAADLIEMADLRERVRKLESIAACIDP